MDKNDKPDSAIESAILFSLSHALSTQTRSSRVNEVGTAFDTLEMSKMNVMEVYHDPMQATEQGAGSRLYATTHCMSHAIARHSANQA
jgi:hypothetical protein